MSGSEQSGMLGCMEIWGGNRNAEETFALPGLDVWLRARAWHSDQGGDLHYLSTCGHAAVLRFVVADVAGHGARVAPIAERFKRLIVKHMNTLDQSRLATALNDEFLLDQPRGLFITTVMTSYYRPTGHLVVCNAGHPPPLHYRAASDTWTTLVCPPDASHTNVMNLPFGIIEPTEYAQFAVESAPGDYVVMYSDAYSDARVDGTTLGVEGLLKIASACALDGASEFGEQFHQRFTALTGRDRSTDDETLIVLRPINRAPPRYSVRERMLAFGKVLGVIPVR